MLKMGIINLTPDSFYAPSRVEGEAALRARIADLLARGCSILDLGAVSTRPGAEDVSTEEEWRRLQPALRVAAEAAKVSVDTTSSEMVRRVYAEIGAFIVNDISAGEDDPAMLPTVAELGLPCIAMHKRGNPRSMDALADYPQGVTEAVLEYFRAFEAKAQALGIQEWILDPGFGFAKTSEQNWQLLRDLPHFKVFGRPVLAGVADKRFTKDPLFNGGDPSLAERLAVEGGADILRIH